MTRCMRKMMTRVRPELLRPGCLKPASYDYIRSRLTGSADLWLASAPSWLRKHSKQDRQRLQITQTPVIQGHLRPGLPALLTVSGLSNCTSLTSLRGARASAPSAVEPTDSLPYHRRGTTLPASALALCLTARAADLSTTGCEPRLFLHRNRMVA
jgi:hypothetical protein